MAMIKMEIDLISKQMIKPSSPTPPNLKTHKLSIIDQLSPAIYIPLIFWYPFEQHHNINDYARNVQLLKQSLSDALTKFYPLAGRLHGNISIDCNDAGAEFIEAQIHANLSQFVETSNMEELRQFIPMEGSMTKNCDVLLAIQVSLFDCGGIAIGVCMSHKVGDGLSTVTFINAWAAIARGDVKNIVEPNFNMASIFPPIDFGKSDVSPSIGITSKKIFTKRVVFTKEKINDLKIKSVLSGSHVKDPTRVEALSSFLWKHFIDTSKLKEDSNKKIFAAGHAVNLRSRMTPMLSDHSFGNIWAAIVALSNQENELGNEDLVQQLRSAIRKIDSEYVKILQNGEELLKYYGKLEEMDTNREVMKCSFSSWFRFPVYEVDFGWGKPDWVCTTTQPYENFIIFMSTKCGEGIEAWINMLEGDDFFYGST